MVYLKKEDPNFGGFLFGFPSTHCKRLVSRTKRHPFLFAREASVASLGGTPPYGLNMFLLMSFWSTLAGQAFYMDIGEAKEPYARFQVVKSAATCCITLFQLEVSFLGLGNMLSWRKSAGRCFLFSLFASFCSATFQAALNLVVWILDCWIGSLDCHFLVEIKGSPRGQQQPRIAGCVHDPISPPAPSPFRSSGAEPPKPQVVEQKMEAIQAMIRNLYKLAARLTKTRKVIEVYIYIYIDLGLLANPWVEVYPGVVKKWNPVYIYI